MPLSLSWVQGKRNLVPRRVHLSTLWHHLEKQVSPIIFRYQTARKGTMGWKHTTLVSSAHKSVVGAEDFLGITMQRKKETRLIIHMQNYSQHSPTDWRQGGKDRQREREEGRKRDVRKEGRRKKHPEFPCSLTSQLTCKLKTNSIFL